MTITLTNAEISALVEDLGLLYNDTIIENVYDISYKNILETYLTEIVGGSSVLGFFQNIGKYVTDTYYTVLQKFGPKIGISSKTIFDSYKSQFTTALNTKDWAAAKASLKGMISTGINFLKKYAITSFQTFAKTHPASAAVIKTAITPITTAFTSGHAVIGILLTVGYAAAAIGITLFIAKLAIAGIKAIFRYLLGLDDQADKGNATIANSAVTRMNMYRSMAEKLRGKLDAARHKQQ